MADWNPSDLAIRGLLVGGGLAAFGFAVMLLAEDGPISTMGIAVLLVGLSGIVGALVVALYRERTSPGYRRGKEIARRRAEALGWRRRLTRWLPYLAFLAAFATALAAVDSVGAALGVASLAFLIGIFIPLPEDRK